MICKSSPETHWVRKLTQSQPAYLLNCFGWFWWLCVGFSIDGFIRFWPILYIYTCWASLSILYTKNGVGLSWIPGLTLSLCNTRHVWPILALWDPYWFFALVEAKNWCIWLSKQIGKMGMSLTPQSIKLVRWFPVAGSYADCLSWRTKCMP